MASGQVASEDSLVVKPRGDAPGLRAGLASFGEVETIGDSGLLLVRVDGAPEEARRRILDGLAEVEWVQPLLLDERRSPHVPTGEVTVRFGSALPDEELERFASAHGLGLRRRNEFVPEQASFAPVEPRRALLPDVVQSLLADDRVDRAWANTLSRYRRG